MSHNGNGRHCFSFAEFRLYPEERLLLQRDGARVALTPRVLDVLIVLVSRHGELVSKETLLESVWADSFVEEGNVNRTVSTLRKNLGTQANGNDFIETVPKTGYRFIAQVEEGVDEPEPQLLHLPWSTVRRPVFWATAVAGLVMLVLLASSYVPSKFSSDANNEQANLSNIVPEPGSSEPIRLTHDPARHAYPIWTEDDRIRFTYHGRNKQGEPYIMDSNGENQTPVNDIPLLRQGVWSPNGRSVYFWKYNDPAAYLADADGGNEKELSVGLANSSWSPDGSRIVFQGSTSKGTTNDMEISVYNLATEKTVNITNHPAFDADPSWSPDGNQIIFVSNREGNFEIYSMNSDGSGLRRLTDHPAWESHPVFSPDGTHIAFNSNRKNENSDIYLMSTDGLVVANLTESEINEEIGPGGWSPDGTKIAFTSRRSGNDDIYVMNVDPFRPQLVLADESADVSGAAFSPNGEQIVYQADLADKTGELRIHDVVSDQSRLLLKTANGNLRPGWSPDGSRIVFQNKVGGKTSLFLIHSNGNNLTNLTNNPTSDTIPSWSPDGSQIVFLADDYGRTRLYKMNTGTGDQHPLSPEPGWEVDPAWSPDGTSIAFSCDRLDGPGNGLEICVADANGGSERRLLFRRGHDSQPAWSPDGARIAFVASSDGNPEIYLINADGTGLLRLTRNTAEDIFPRWSVDGRNVIFTSNRSGKNAIYQIEPGSS